MATHAIPCSALGQEAQILLYSPGFHFLLGWGWGWDHGGDGGGWGGGVLVNNLHDWKAKELSLPQSARIVVLYCGMTHSI